jgi:hypothetical protein
MFMRRPSYLGEDSGSQAIAGEFSRIVAQSRNDPKIVSQTVSHWLSHFPNPLLHTLLRLEARVGIEHHNPIHTNLHNSQQDKPLRSFLNVFNILRRVLWLQELFWKYLLLFANQPRTIATLLFYWRFCWGFIGMGI